MKINPLLFLIPISCCLINAGCHNKLRETSAHSATSEQQHDPTQSGMQYFTPNGDGVNDVFVIYMNSSAIDSARITIFNRWSEKVYETTEIIDNMIGYWDGSYQNKPCPAGGYYLLLTYTVEGEPKEYTGTITIIRQ